MRRLAWLVAALGALGCSAEVSPPLGDRDAAVPVRGGTLRMASFTDVRSLDAAVAFDEVSHALESLIYATLVTLSPTGEIEPELVESWTVDDARTRYVFRLRAGVVMQDGHPLTADDVKRSIERALSPDTPCPVASFYERILGFSDYASRRASTLRGVEVLGDHLFAVSLSEPDATLLAVLSLPIVAPVCRSAGRAFDREFSLHPCGAGPFRLERWEPGRQVNFRRFDGYFRPGLPYLDRIEWALAVPQFTQRFRFEAGEQDFLHDFTSADLWRYRASPAWRGRGEWEPAKAVHSFFMNTELPPFDDVHVRRAVAFAIDRDEIARLRPGETMTMSRLIPPAVPGHDPSPGQRFDLARAREELAKAGYAFDPSTGRGGYPKEIDYACVGDSFDQQAAEVYQQQLARIGVRIRVKTRAWSAYLAETSRRRTTPMGSDGWAMDFPDPSDFFEPILSTRAIGDEDSQNRAFWSNPAFDALLAEARRAQDFDARMRLYRRAEQLVIDEAPWVMVYTKRWFNLHHPYVGGFAVNPSRTQDVGRVWIDQATRARALGRRAELPFSRLAKGALAARWP